MGCSKSKNKDKAETGSKKSVVKDQVVHQSDVPTKCRKINKEDNEKTVTNIEMRKHFMNDKKEVKEESISEKGKLATMTTDEAESEDDRSYHSADEEMNLKKEEHNPKVP